MNKKYIGIIGCILGIIGCFLPFVSVIELNYSYFKGEGFLLSMIQRKNMNK